MDRTVRRLFIRSIRFIKAEEGVVMTEFTIIDPLFVFMITGTIQFMGIAHADAMIQYANYMAARAGIVHYESSMNNWNPEYQGTAGLTQVMEEAAEHAMGPFYQPIVGYEQGMDPNRPILMAPAGAMDIRAFPGTINLGNNARYNPIWLTSELEVDLGLPYPWVGRVMQAMHVGADPIESEEEAAARGMDPFANRSEPGEMQTMYYGDMPFIVVRSDAYLDTRNDITENRTPAYPFNQTGGFYARLNGSTNTLGNQAEPHPIALPVQSRGRPYYGQ
jgi:hypothetical protein